VIEPNFLKDFDMAIYMQIDGVTGNVTESKHPKWIEINSFNFGCGRGVASRTPGHTENREASTVSIREISISKEMDETSPTLFSMACVGKGKTVKIDFCRTGDNPQIYASYELSNVLISSYSTSGGGSGDSPHESLSLNFDKIMYSYTPYKDDGSAGTPIKVTYDLGQAIAS
jgi:type VI secretion system secreted protein Hcp